MNTFKTRTLAASLLISLMATAVYAEPGPRNAPDPQARAEARAERLATIPGLTQAQRDDIIRIEDETRAAQRALMETTRSERQQLRDEGMQKLRAALGDKAYADYVTWKVEHRSEHRRGHGQGRMGKGPPPGASGDTQAPAGE